MSKTTTRWRPGQSGNPAGRPPGTGEIGKLRAAIKDRLPSIIEKLTEQAAAGDIGAARLLLERVLPALKPIELPATIAMTGDTLTDQGRSAMAAVCQGQLSPGQGVALLSSLGTLAKLIETDDLMQRVEALEARQGAIR